MVSRVSNPDFWKRKRVFLTGHTGFKGSWARLWLSQMGAEVTGYSLPPEQSPSLHDILGSGDLTSETIADIRDYDPLLTALKKSEAEIILHLAAQPLVRRSYITPMDTFDVNVMGTVRLLEAARHLPSLRTLLTVTTDKVYKNDESGRHFVETDSLGGHDPYSGSKAAAELVVSTYRGAFYDGMSVPIATARGGNVLGGGDFSEDRLIPDIVRAAIAGKRLVLRNPHSTRPWQHVLDCLNGYFLFCEDLYSAKTAERALNFGPPPTEKQLEVGSIATVLNEALGQPLAWEDASSPDQPREMQSLGLDSERAGKALGWHSHLSQLETLEWTARWYDSWRRGQNMRDITSAQIQAFMNPA